MREIFEALFSFLKFIDPKLQLFSYLLHYLGQYKAKDIV